MRASRQDGRAQATQHVQEALDGSVYQPGGGLRSGGSDAPGERPQPPGAPPGQPAAADALAPGQAAAEVVRLARQPRPQRQSDLPLLWDQPPDVLSLAAALQPPAHPDARGSPQPTPLSGASQPGRWSSGSASRSASSTPAGARTSSRCSWTASASSSRSRRSDAS